MVAGDDSDFLRSQLDRIGQPELGGVLLAIVSGDGTMSHAAVGGDLLAEGLHLEDAFRIGSVTKVFTAVLTLTLVDQGLIGLDDAASEHLGSLPVAADVTVRHLLSHRSGIPDYTDDAIFGTEEDGLAKAWTPEELYEIVAELPPGFEPGERFSYSNTNYLILGAMIEEVTGVSYAESLRDRLLDPLSLSHTYQAFYEKGEPPVDAFTGVGQVAGSVVPVDFDYTSIETSAWASGDLVSTVEDLATFFRALTSGEVMSKDLIDEMIPTDQYGLGLESLTDNDDVVGHRGGIPGYNTLILHDATTSRTAVLFSNNDTISFNTLTNPIAARLAG